MASKTTQRSLKLLRETGWTAEVVERWNPFARVRHDMFGFIDIFCMCPHRGFLGVQTTVAGKVNERLKKIAAEPKAQHFLNAGGRIIVHGWKKAGKRHPTVRPGSWFTENTEYTGQTNV
jgi:hypothetical protein